MRAPLFSETIVRSPGTFSKTADNLTMLEAEYGVAEPHPFSCHLALSCQLLCMPMLPVPPCLLPPVPSGCCGAA